MDHFIKRFVQKVVMCVAVTGFTLMAVQVAAQNIYSKGTGNWDDVTNWSLTSHAGLPCACTPGAGNTVLIGSGHIITYRSGLPAAVTVAAMTIDDGGGGTLTFGNGATVTTLSVTGDLLINSGGTLQSGATGATNHNIQVGGDLTNNNVLNQNANAATNQKMTFTGTGPANQNVGGTGGTFNFRNFTKNTTAAIGININSSITINGLLSLLSNANLVVGSSSNITLQATATITGYSASRYIQLDGTSATNSQLIRVSSGAVADWQFFFPIGTSGVYSPVDLTSPGTGTSTMTNNPSANATLAVKPIVSLSSEGQLKRTFRLTVAANAGGTVFTNGAFYYSGASDISTGDAQANYTTGWYLNNSTGTWATVTGTAPGAGFFISPVSNQSLGTGIYYYTIGTSTAYPNTWYTYQTGNWSDPNVWTEDPSGTTLSNPLVQPPLPGDQVVILNGFKVTVDVANITTSTTTIQSGAILDMSTFTGHNLGTVDGGGLLRINGINLPGGTFTSFVTATTGGTIEYYNTGGTLPAGQTTYNNLLLSNSLGSNATFVSTNNLTINGTLNITQTAGGGTVTWQINDNSAAKRTLSIAGDVTVSANGLITAGTGNSAATTPHTLSLSGNLVNSGVIKFFDPTDATYSVANYTAGNVYNSGLRGNTVAVTFGGLSNKSLTCNNTTDFYRLILNKGSGEEAILTVNSTAAANFRLFGPANLGSNTGAAPDQLSDCALSLVNGTLQLTGTITIPILNTTGATGNDYFSIPQNAALWINGANVSVTVANASTSNPDQRIMLDGLLRLTNGTLTFGYSKGLGSGDVGIFTVEGGTATMFQFRPRAASASQAFAYNQSGGVVSVGTTGYNGTPALTGVNNTANARFSLPVNSCSFQMTGGILNVGTPTINAPGGIEIQSSSSNYSVTGGTINAYIPTAGSNFSIMSTAPFYNLNVYKEGGGALIFRTDLALTILGNLTLISANSPTFSCNNLALTVGGNIDIQNGTTFTPGTNLITINGTGAQSWNNNGTISGLNNIIIAKSAGTTLTLGGANVFPNIVGAGTGLTLTSGTLADGGKALTVTNAITNNAIHSGSGSITVQGPTTIGGVNGTFGNLILKTTPTVTLSGAQTVTGTLQLNGNPTTLNIASYNLTVLGNITTTNGTGFTTNNRILTSGLHNSGGLTRKATSTVALLFPVGTAAVATTYTPATITVTGTTMGNITVRPVTGAHPNVTTPTQSVQYYWRVTSTGFAGITGVSHSSYTYMNATRDAASTTYRPARYDLSTFSWAYGPTYNATVVTGTTMIPTFNTGVGWTGLAADQLDGEYTAGNSIAFGAVTVFYSSSTPTTWGVNSSWSKTSVGHVADAGATPCATCPVVIGNSSTITINANNQSGGTLTIMPGSTLDCSTFTGLSFGANTGGTVLGNGTLRIASANFPAGDFTNFLGSGGGTVEWYGSTSYTIPLVGPAPQNLPLATYNYLVINPSATFTITMPQVDLTIYSDLTKNGAGTAQTNTIANRALVVAGNLNVSAGTLSLQNASSYTMSITGNTTISTGATFTVTGNTARTHTLTTPGTISNGGTMVFRNTTHVVDLTFTGTTATSLTGNGTTTTLDLVNVNKGTSQANVLTVDVKGAVNTLSNNWLTITNGTINFNNAAYGMTLTNTVTNPYTIGSTARLKVSNGTITISNINADDSDLFLVGTLEVAGGIVTIGSGTNNNNDIQYASAGLPSIIVSGGQLNVNGAIRRSTIVLVGALVYNQSAGSVTVSGRNCAIAPNNTRGIFEIENETGSSFTMSGGQLTISRPTGGSNFTDLYLNPETSSVSAGSLIQVGDNALGAQTLDVNVTPSLGSFQVMGAAGNAQTVNLVSAPLSTSGTLTINTASTLNTNSLNVSVGGDMSVIGTYNGTIGSGNTTTFNGGGAQAATLSATSTFLNMTVNKAAGTVTMAGTAPTITDLNILSGTLDVNTLNLVVIGNITNNSTQSNTGGGSISLAGTRTSQTITSSNGIFGNVTLTGSAGSKVVNVTGNSTINGALNFAVANRFLVIGSYQLTLGTAASVGTPGTSDFIRTNGVSSDLGVVKNWAVAGSTLFTYPVGTLSNYTPIAVTLTVTTPGSLTIIPVNSRHPTYNVASAERVLNYYWIVTRNNTLVCSATGSHVYTYPSALMGGTGGALVAGYLDISNPVGWITGSAGSSASTTTMTFTNNLGTNLPGASNTYHYTVGTVNTLPNPIIPVYSRLDDAGVAAPGTGGSWTDPNCWTTSSTGHGAAYGAAPTGVPVVILSGARINMYTAGPVNTNGRVAFTSKIDGVLVLNNSFGHNLGIISGAGTMRTSTNTFPAGNYTAFVSTLGGTIEYVAPMTMNNRTTYHNLSFSGAGTATMTASDLILNGSMTIPVGVTVNNASSRNISIAGDWSNSGTFTPGTGSVIFTGSLAQGITGATTFYGLTMAGSNNVTLNSTTTVSNLLTMTTGNIVSTVYPAASRLILSSGASVSGGSASSFVDGQMSAILASGSTLDFPLGSISASRFRPVVIGGTGGPASDTWTSSYIGHNPTTDGFSNLTFNAANMAKVSQYEYWQVANASATATASLTLSFDVGSYGGSDIGLLASMKTARWNGSQWDLPPGGGTFSQTGTNVTGTVTVSFQNAFSPQTLATDDPTSSLPIELLSFDASVNGSIVDVKWSTATEVNNDYFTIERTVDFEKFEEVKVVKGQGTKTTQTNYLAIDPSPINGRSYYRLKQTDFNGNHAYSGFRTIDFIDEPFKIYPNPVADHKFTFVLNNAQPSENVILRLVNMQGLTVFEASYKADGNGRINQDIEISNISSGLYVVDVISTTGLKKKIVIE